MTEKSAGLKRDSNDAGIRSSSEALTSNEHRVPRITVLAPSPHLAIGVEDNAHSGADVHIHAGGQGYWAARIANVLGAEVHICSPLGGEVGSAIRGAFEREGLHVHAVHCRQENAAHVADRRGGNEREIVETRSPLLTRHEVDELFNLALAVGLDSQVTILTGPQHSEVLTPDLYRRLAADLRANGARVVADLSGDPLHAALRGGLDLLKVAHGEAIDGGYAVNDSLEALTAAVSELRSRGAERVLLTRGGDPTLAMFGDDLVELHPPQFEVVQHMGAGDSMCGAAAVALASNAEPEIICRLAAAAGALNVTRHGLGSGRREAIERVAARVRVEPRKR
jgi:1-phosphofructokinase